MIVRTANKMKSFEYKVLRDDNTLEALNREGKQGWQVVSYDYKAVLLMREYEE